MDVREHFQQRWSTAEKPELVDFIKSNSVSALHDIVELAVVDQQFRWLHGCPRQTREIARALPQLATSPSYFGRLAANEFQCRLLEGETLDELQFSNGFPELSEWLPGKLKGILKRLPAQCDAAALPAIDREFQDELVLGRQLPISHFLIAYHKDLRTEIVRRLARHICLRQLQQGQSPQREQFAYDVPEAYLPPIAFFASLPQELSPLSSASEASFATRDPSSSPDESPLQTGTFISQRKLGDTAEGRYRLLREIGAGNFGRVYAAVDEELKRQVAIKVPNKKNFRSSSDLDAYLNEARAIASLDHPNIVPVYDVGRTSDGAIYVVAKFIQGMTLAQRIKASTLTFTEAAHILQKMGMALEHAHSRRLIHRDVKPANILIEESTGVPYLVDFGLAVRELDHVNSDIAGTPCYMSPEQALGEGHRLDGRSDIYSAGVVFYEMLTGRRPFDGQTINELLHKTVSVEPRPPREIRGDIPDELERICHKMLRKRASERYTTARELIDDLQHWLDGNSDQAVHPASDTPIVPRGLRSFDYSDASFFLDLLPGVRNRDGLPESIAFWQRQINQRSAELTFSVGLVYGPSGCGKSSLIKAGLIPRLAKYVLPIYIEADATNTESRLLAALGKQLPNLVSGETLSQAMYRLRTSSDRKVVIFIDQFEQWLHASSGDRAESELVKALRQCDGGRLQAVLMVRDDFAMAAARFMNELDVAVIQGQNFATVDLFDLAHAQRVLMKFGQAFGKLPQTTSQVSDAQIQFIAESVESLAEQGKVIPVRLAILAEMLKQKEWQPTTLSQIGGSQGIAINFLDDTFSASTANPQHRYFSQAAQHVLRALLPQTGSNLKGAARSQDDLYRGIGDGFSREEFYALLRMLDGELRLISPVDVEGDSLSGSGKNSGQVRYFQLTHDYLVPALRSWLTRKQRETPRGRAELKLAECTAAWTLRRENRELPSLAEWLKILLRTSPERWTDNQRKLLRRCNVFYGNRALIALLVLSTLTATGWLVRQQLLAKQMVVSLLAEEPRLIAARMDAMKDLSTWTRKDLLATFSSQNSSTRARLNACLSLIHQDASLFPQFKNFLNERLLELSASEFQPVCELLESFGDRLAPDLWQLAENQSEPAEHRLRAACALSLWNAADSRWKNTEWCTTVVNLLVAANPFDIPNWRLALENVSKHLSPPLMKIIQSPESDLLTKDYAFSLMLHYGRDNPKLTAQCLAEADPRNFGDLLANLRSKPEASVAELVSQITPPTRKIASQESKPPPEPGNQWVEAIEAAQGMIDAESAFCLSMPLPQFQLIVEELRPSGYRPVRVRPYQTIATPNDQHEFENTLISAVWTRDTCDWEIEFEGDHRQLRKRMNDRADKWLLEDAAAIGYRTPGESDAAWMFLWVAKADAKEKRSVLIDVAQSQWEKIYKSVSREYPSLHSVSLRVDAQKQYLLTTILRNTGPECELVFNDTLLEKPYRCELDVDLARTSVLTPEARSKRLWQGLLKNVENDPDYVAGLTSDELLDRIQAAYDLGHFKECLELIDQNSQRLTQPMKQIRKLAQLRQSDGTGGIDIDVADDHPMDAVYFAAQFEAWNKRFDEAHNQLQLAMDKSNVPALELYILARASAQCMQAALQAKDPAHTELFAHTTFDLLEECWQHRWELKGAMKIRSQWEFRPLFEWKPEGNAELVKKRRRFEEIEKAAEPRGPLTRILSTDTSLESKLVRGHGVLSTNPTPVTLTQESQNKVKHLREQGFRVVSVAALPATDTKPAQPNKRLDFVILLQRRIPTLQDKEREYQRQARSAMALLQLNEAQHVLRLLKHSPDPERRSLLITLIPQYILQPDPNSALLTLDRQSDPSILRAQILLMGKYADRSAPPDAIRAAWIEQLQAFFKNHDDAGVHSACDWTLRKLGTAPANLPEGSQNADRRQDGQWFKIKTHEHTFTAIAPTPFVMGSPIYEDERLGGKEGVEENQHLRTIPRTYAISTREVSIEQMLELKKLLNLSTISEANRNYATTANVPAHQIRYYDAARYCNWLSEKEQIPKDQWCYEPDTRFDSGLRARKNYLHLTGYRLPTEAEWEYACRAGTTTSRYFGDSPTLLPEYAGFTDNSQNRQIFPRGSFMPNDYGLFDMHGNVVEWCIEPHVDYAYRLGQQTDDEFPFQVTDNLLMVVRGGSFFNLAPNVRSAYRVFFVPTSSHSVLGFRVARTLRNHD